MANWTLKNKVVVITGATGGLGRALSQLLATKGCRLGLIDLDQATLDKMAGEFGSSVAIACAANVRKSDQLQSAMKCIADKFGSIDVVVAGAGIEIFYPTLQVSDQAFERIIDINLTGIFRTFKAAYPWIKESKGYLLTISSMAAFVHIPYGSGYAASKAGNYAFSNALRSELEPFGISVGSVHPTWFDTPMVQGVKKRPAWKYLTNDDKSLIARPTSIETVTKEIVSAIEGRKSTVIVPWHLKTIAYMSGYLQPLFRWLGPSVEDRERAYSEFMKEPKL